MASIFTYDPNPPKVSSPWLTPEDPGTPDSKGASTPGSRNTHAGSLADYGVTKLQAEPQQGPTEYKLHLLLRPRRAYKSMSTSTRPDGGSSPQTRASTPCHPASGVGSTSGPAQTRQQRLLHLTTQLLWRMQQSLPYHASRSKEILLPQLPDATVELEVLEHPRGLLPGLEESRGALYEIGVSDDGTLVGLTKDEMDESIKTLRVMAGSLGCVVEVLRQVIVGDCEWIETMEPGEKPGTLPREFLKSGKLWVAEAHVTPNLGVKVIGGSHSTSAVQATLAVRGIEQTEDVNMPSRGSSRTPQLRVTFTGPTTAGKTSLLGTLSMGTLDNGRGKSRINLLKHRHEVVSGVTSAIAQELIGYKEGEIRNYSQGYIESWVDIHDHSSDGRLVLVTDSGGHPRYRRTVLRGLMNWAPHWSFLCIAADDGEAASGNYGTTPSAQDILGVAAAGVDLGRAHLKLSLKLGIPMAVVITKLDLASKASLQKTMSQVLTEVKEAGRLPKIIQPDQKQHESLQRIPVEDRAKIAGVVADIGKSESLARIVPIILTSAVRGIGIGLLHSLLEQLPMPPTPTSRDLLGMALNPEQPKCLFHIDDTFNLAVSNGDLTCDLPSSHQGVIVSGHIRFGTISVGDNIVVGPFPPQEEDIQNLAPDDRASPGSYGLSISHPSSAELAKIAMKNAVSASTVEGEWHDAKVVSIRNVRLPVLSLEAGQAGTIGVVFDNRGIRRDTSSSGSETPARIIRRGMVLAIPSKLMLDTGLSLQAASGFTATFADPGAEALVVGSFVNVYIASVRAAARIRGVSHRHHSGARNQIATDDIDDVFSLSEDAGNGSAAEVPGYKPEIELFLELLHSREWVELGSQVLVLEGGTQDRSGLEGYVGKVVEIVE